MDQRFSQSFGSMSLNSGPNLNNSYGQSYGQSYGSPYGPGEPTEPPERPSERLNSFARTVEYQNQQAGRNYSFANANSSRMGSYADRTYSISQSINHSAGQPARSGFPHFSTDEENPDTSAPQRSIDPQIDPLTDLTDPNTSAYRSSAIPQFQTAHQLNVIHPVISGSTYSDAAPSADSAASRNHQPIPSTDPRSPFHTPVPTSSSPTEILASRFQIWRKIIRGLNAYFLEFANVQEEVVRQHIRLAHAVNFPFFQNGGAGPAGTRPAASASSAAASTSSSSSAAALDQEAMAAKKFFLPYGAGSIQDVPGGFLAFHKISAANASRVARELHQIVIPRLEELRRDLLVKIREIRNLASDFKNTVAKEQALTGRDLENLASALEMSRAGSSAVLNPKRDPYLLKLVADRQIRKQILEENYLQEAFLNLQGSARELEKVVVQEVQQSLLTFSKLVSVEAHTILDYLVAKIDNGFPNVEPAREWDEFIARDSNFVDPALPLRNVSEIVYPHMNDPIAVQVRAGYLERRSKFLKSYSKGWYVLTPSFLHEFKIPDRRKDPIPVMSLSLDDCQLSEHSKSSSGSEQTKFVLFAKQNGIISRGHNWVFRAEIYEEMAGWYADLKALTELSDPASRAQWIRRRRRRSKGQAALEEAAEEAAEEGEEINEEGEVGNEIPEGTEPVESEQPKEGEITGIKTANSGIAPTATLTDTSGAYLEPRETPTDNNEGLGINDGTLITPVQSSEMEKASFIPLRADSTGLAEVGKPQAGEATEGNDGNEPTVSYGGREELTEQSDPQHPMHEANGN